MTEMAKILEECLYLGNTVSSSTVDKGMAAVHVRYHPYVSKWFAYVDWSDSSKVQTEADSVDEAVMKLREQLQVEVDKIDWDEAKKIWDG